MLRWAAMTQLLFLGLLLGTLLYALLRGAAPERWAAGLIAAATILSALVPKTGKVAFGTFEPYLCAVDTATAIAFVLLALYAQRYWPMWLAALQIDTVVTHLAMLVAPRVMPWAYAVIEIAWSYPIVVLLAVGTARHRQRLRQYGDDPSWRQTTL